MRIAPILLPHLQDGTSANDDGQVHALLDAAVERFV